MSEATDAPKFAVEAIDLFERDVVLRMPFRFGVVTLTSVNVVVFRSSSPPLPRTARPMYTCWFMEIVCGEPCVLQVTPSTDLNPAIVFPARTSFTQYGALTMGPTTCWAYAPADERY